MKNNMTDIVRQAQNMQNRIAKIQEQFEDRKVEASTGGGAVTAMVNGKQELLDIKIDPELLNPEEAEILQEMIVGAVNQAMKSAGEMVNTEIEKVTGGFNIPGLF